MNAAIFCLPLAAMLGLWLFNELFQDPGRVCPMCGGRREHGRNCPWKD